ncbi:MAG: hypothetical protein KatS3mg110_3803 [Pirellulaceae bacterium]|nr:MAG: hypothetical protein KatS3mg110_3803 [Pirellulaceae bacterium]
MSAAARRRVPVLSGAGFSRACGLAVETNSLAEFRRRLRNQPALVIDDVHRAGRSRLAQEELLFLLDSFEARGLPVVVTRPADQFFQGSVAAALESRLAGGLSIRLFRPASAGLALLARWTAMRAGCDLPEEVSRSLVQAFLNGRRGPLERVSSTAEFLEFLVGYLRRLLVERLPPAEVLNRYQQFGRPARPTIRAVAERVARIFQVGVSELRGPSRRRQLATARRIAMYLAHQLCGKTLQQVGAYFDGRDHTTVLYACRQVEKLLGSDTQLEELVCRITRELLES